MVRREHPDGPILDVVVIGAGQSGLATAFGLRRESVTNVVVLDRNPAGREGPRVNFARMMTLRTPKMITGVDVGMPALTPRAWYEAQWAPMHGRSSAGSRVKSGRITSIGIAACSIFRSRTASRCS